MPTRLAFWAFSSFRALVGMGMDKGAALSYFAVVNLILLMLCFAYFQRKHGVGASLLGVLCWSGEL